MTVASRLIDSQAEDHVVVGGVSIMSLDLDSLLDGLRSRIMKQPTLTYHIKTRQELTRRESLKSHMRKPECPIRDSLHGGLSRISSPLRPCLVHRIKQD